jgi:hypothetical protein
LLDVARRKLPSILCDHGGECDNRSFTAPVSLMRPLMHSRLGRPGAVETNVTVAAKKTEPRDLVADAARRALEDAKGDVRNATAMMQEAVRLSRQLRDMLTEPLIANACYDAVRAQCHKERRKVWQPPVEQLRKSKVEGAFRVVQLAAGTLLMFPLPGGKKLGEATREEISAATSFYDSQAGDMAHKARWLRLVAQSVPDGKTVGEVMTDARLRELQEAARAE